MQTFAEATAVLPRGDAFEAHLDPQWAVGDKLHGGYLMAVLGRAAATASDHPDLSAISTVFLRPPLPGNAAVAVEVLRTGVRSDQLRARLEQDGQVCAEALITQGALEDTGPWWTNAVAPTLPDEDDCYHLTSNPAPGPGFPVPLMDVVEHRVDPAALGFAIGNPATDGRVGAWLRMADGSDWDPLSVLVALDMVPPVSLVLGLPGWAPTITLTAYLRRRPAPGPLRVTMHATDITAGRMDETAQAWDAGGNLVAQATQLAAVRT